MRTQGLSMPVSTCICNEEIKTNLQNTLLTGVDMNNNSSPAAKSITSKLAVLKFLLVVKRKKKFDTKYNVTG